MKIKKLIYHIVKPLLPNSIIMRLKENDSYKCRFIKDPSSLYPCVAHIKDATWEEVSVPEVYSVSKAHTMSQYMNPLDMYVVENAVVADDCDVVMTPEGALWAKRNDPMFSKEIIMDVGYYKHDTHYIYMRKGKETHVEGNCLSLLGLYASEWAHFIVQNLPKLYFAAEEGLLKEPITVLVPEFKDKQILQILNEFKQQYPSITYCSCKSTRKELSYVRCDKLYYMSDAAIITKHGAYVMPYDIVIPQVTRDILYHYLVNPLVEKVKNNPIRHDKLFLVRRGAMRAMTNWQEVESYFVKQGFYPVEPHLLTLEEKVDLFYHSKVIVGPHSSAWTNMVFADKVKMLMITPICRTIDMYLGYFINDKDVSLVQVTGRDLSARDIHTAYTVSLDRIKLAYNMLMNE